jgi:hypothetical protein
VIPVETPWHFTTWLDLFDHWQTVIAGVLAFVAGFGTVAATMIIARRQINAAHEEAGRVIAATRAQTEATFKQTEATVRLEDLRKASEALAFHVMLEAAMARVLVEATWAKETYPQYVAQAQGASVDALTVRQRITKGAFAELRAACVRRGSPLTGEFLDLEREIDSFAMQGVDTIVNAGMLIRWGKHAGLREQFALIERKAGALREKAFERFSGSVAAPGPFATAEAEALIGAPSPPVSAPEPRRSWLRWWFGWRAAG